MYIPYVSSSHSTGILSTGTCQFLQTEVNLLRSTIPTNTHPVAHVRVCLHSDAISGALSCPSRTPARGAGIIIM